MYRLAALWLTVITSSEALVKITRLEVPETVDPRKPAELLCEFQQVNDGLNSVKWLRNGKEFVQYRPEMSTPQIYEVDGISSVNATCNLSLCRVIVTVTKFPSLSVIRCDVSGERPRFVETHKESYMGVLALPEKPPKIMDVPEHVLPNTETILNCTSGFSLPPAEVIWYINGRQENGTENGVIENDGLFNSWSTISLTVYHKEVKQVECRWRVTAYGRKPIEKHHSILLADDETLNLNTAQKITKDFSGAEMKTATTFTLFLSCWCLFLLLK